MKKNLAFVGAFVAMGALLGAQGWAQAPVVEGRPPLQNPTLTGFDEAMGLLRTSRWLEAAEAYRKLVNVNDTEQRGQARYGLAVALAQLGQEDKALTALEGTLADETPLGKAVAELRGKLLLQLADKALATDGSGTAGKWLGQYERLTVMPDRPRYERIKGAGEVVAGSTVGTPTLVLRVGVLLPFSGPLKPVGDDILRGLQLGIRDFDGRRGTRVELLPMDAVDAATAKASAEKLLAQNVDVVLGPLTSLAVDAVKDDFRAKGVPMLVLSSDRGVVGQGVHALNYLPAEQARAAAQAAVLAGRTQFVGLIPSTPYGYEVFDAFQDEAKRLGAEVIASSFYNPQHNDIGASIRTLVGNTSKMTSATFRLPFDAMFVPASASSMPLVASQLSYHDVDRTRADGRKTLLLGTALWQDPGMLTSAASGARGGVFAVPPKDSAFEDTFRASFSTAPHPLALLGYDGLRVLADIAAEKQRTGRPVGDLLLRPEGFYGSGGFIRFTASGVTQRGLNIVKVGEQFEVEQTALNMAPIAVPANLQPTARGKGWKW